MSENGNGGKNNIVSAVDYSPAEWMRRATYYAGQLLTIGEIIAEPFAHRGLTKREAEAARYASRGLSTSQIAEAMVISPHTAKTLLDRAKKKLGVPIRDLPEIVFNTIERVLLSGLPYPEGGSNDAD
jgi:DNA-binding CsgD family transcriptional regulator